MAILDGDQLEGWEEKLVRRKEMVTIAFSLEIDQPGKFRQKCRDFCGRDERSPDDCHRLSLQITDQIAFPVV